MKIKLATIPFRCDTFEQARDLRNKMIDAQVILETRGDETSLTYEGEEWYVVVSTGNIRGMIEMLEEEGFM
nr:MAG TPA: hypothetical protein [Caudoviricetes sp.]